MVADLYKRQGYRTAYRQHGCEDMQKTQSDDVLDGPFWRVGSLPCDAPRDQCVDVDC